MTETITKIFLTSLYLNLFYEVLHSDLYKTCRQASFKKYAYLMVKACVFDGLAITAIYYLSYLIFKNQNIFENYFQLIFFSVISLFFAYFWEIYSIKAGKWEYSKNMPLIFGVGLTPLLQLFLTGILSIYYSI